MRIGRELAIFSHDRSRRTPVFKGAARVREIAGWRRHLIAIADSHRKCHAAHFVEEHMAMSEEPTRIRRSESEYGVFRQMKMLRNEI